MDDWFGVHRGLVAVGLLAAVPGCPADDKGTASDSATTNPGTTSATEGPVTETGTSGGTSGETPTGTDSGSATDSGTGTTGTGTTGEPTTGGTGTSTTGGADIPPVCKAYGAKIAECYGPRYAGMTEQYCAISLMAYEMYGADCVKAFEDFLACLSGLSCEVLMSDMPFCEAEGAALNGACA